MKLPSLHNSRNTNVLLTAVFVLVLVTGDVAVFSAVASHVRRDAQQTAPDRVYTAEELARFDGTSDSAPVLLAMDGYVYDISPGRDAFYGPGKAYHVLAGTDASALLHIAGGQIIARKYKIVGRYRP